MYGRPAGRPQPRLTIMPERATCKFGDALIEYTVVRSARRKKTIEITLNPQDGVVVKVPSRTSRQEIDGIVRQRADWILRKASANILRPTPRRFLSGETLPYLGRTLSIVSEAACGKRVSVRLEDDALHIGAPSHLNEQERVDAVHAAVERWYRARAASCLPKMVERWRPAVTRYAVTRVLIRGQRKRWGSCSSDGSIRLNWRIMMAAPALIEYVVVHELAHLNVMNHSPRYWKQVERAMPDYRARRKRLNDVGVQLWL